MGFVIFGVVCLALAVAGFFYMQHTKSELHTMIGTDTLPIPELERLRGISDELGARGGFRKVSEVVGAAHPRPEGALTSELSKSPCVWYKYRVEREYEHVEYRDGRRHRSKRRENVANFTSSAGYALIDNAGRTIGVDPNGAGPEGVEQTVDSFEPNNGRGNSGGMLGQLLPNLLGGNQDSTIGFHYAEWVIRPGRMLYILGEVHDKIGPLVIGKPEQKGHFIVAAKTEEELRSERTRRHKMLSIGVIAAFVIGVALTVVGAVS